MKAVADALITNCANFFRERGKSSGVLGLSGGVDSSVVAAIAVRALGESMVRGFFLPHRDVSAAEHLADAKDVAHFLRIPSTEIEISELCAPFFSLPFVQKQMTRGNMMARVRMMLLYAAAYEQGALVLGTGNRSELLTGFFTKWGDGAVDVEVLGEVWKTEVFALARYFGIPRRILEKDPTAELFVGHRDEDELQISYAKLDPILACIIADPEGFSPRTPEEHRAFLLFLSSAHKREGVISLSRQ